MALFQMNFYSDALDQTTTVNVILPEGRKNGKFKTLWLLHGLTDDHTAWMRYSSVERYAKEHRIAVVMPCVDRSWYTDTAYGKKYFTFVTKELPDKIGFYCNGYSYDREDNLIIGLSMGGYGALKAALTYPEKYCFCASLSGALDITRYGRDYSLAEWRSIFGFDMKDASELAGSEHDVFALAEKKADFPSIYIWCGTEDSLYPINEKFSAHLSALSIDHTFKYSEGDHTWKYWDMQLKKSLELWRSEIQA
ncbi:MAG: esterase family protein [Ruminococcaceae bacterium]|nr:esterase family protein [Oscillospiraceae bacterium]